ncbi:MAG: palmitoyltransferase pfa5, partial [Thelocarpon impressellum]
MAPFDPVAGNIWVSRLIPVVLLGAVSYASWVVVDLLCVDYLLRPSTDAAPGPRPGAAVAILVVYFILLLIMVATYLRLLQTILTNPGLVPRGPRWYQEQREKMLADRRSHSDSSASKEKPWTHVDLEPGGSAAPQANVPGSSPADSPQAAAPLVDFYSKDMFICEWDGQPRWCSWCLNWKPDRTHHCSEMGQCVRKMDHFCPWVGGIVSETSFKFFIQFVTYGGVFCAFTMTTMAIFVSERRHETGRLSVHWVMTLGLSALFMLFGFGMAGSSIHLTLLNSTTVENLSRKGKVHNLAVYLPPAVEARLGAESPMVRMTYAPTGGGPSRTFGVIATPPGLNPWHLGSYGANWRSVMGERPLDWLLPVRHSPCTDHSNADSQFRFGPAVARLRCEKGLFGELPPAPAPAAQTQQPERQRRPRRQRRRRRHRSSSAPPTPTTM